MVIIMRIMEKENVVDLLKKITDEEVETRIKEFSQAIKLFRKREKLSQEQFAQNTGLSRKTIQRIEHGKIKISLNTFIKIILRYPCIFPFEEINKLQYQIDERYTCEIQKNKQ